nr:hypothetical protein B0A51_02801 [Rachicladosporium sp. CCFEE 5018]
MAPMIQEFEDVPSPGTKIELTDVESSLRRLLLDVAAYIDKDPPASYDEYGNCVIPKHLQDQPVTLRFTGGWVRDKLLGIGSHDIDIAINKMTGYQFGLRLKQYLEIPGNPEKYGLDGVATTDKENAKAGASDKSKTVGGLHKIEVNPEKSKHLETVTTRIFALDLDLVNLRKETYTDDSRNPQMDFGTPEEDALRRDATVNAMFYNLNTQEVEDFTGRGHDDLASKIIRTPLEPYQTFKDDPLRVLRLIRFASRLGFTIDQPALKAMRNAEIKDALQRKISRERVGVELEKALQGPDPHEAMRLIFDLDLYFTLFCDPTTDPAKHYTPDTGGCRALLDELETLMEDGSTISRLLLHAKNEQYLAWMLAAAVPYRDAPDPQPIQPGRKPPPPIPSTVAREGVKATNRVCDVITASYMHRNEIRDLVDRVESHRRRPERANGTSSNPGRDVLGMAVRRWSASWRSQVLYSLLVAMVEQPDSVDAVQRRYSAFLTHLQNLNLLDAYTFKPLLDGKQLAKALNTSPGVWMKDALDVVMAWQLRNPDVKDPTEAIQEVKNHGELTSSLVSHFLQLTVRPLFAKSKPDSLTEQGRKKNDPGLPPKLSMMSGNVATTPWKSEKNGVALDLLAWSVRSLDAKTVEQYWHLLVPPILTLIDDVEIRWKLMGVGLLRQTLAATPSSLLERTGLAPVFEDALMPCLLHLPSLTPEPDSIALLSTTYPALLALARLQFPITPPSTSKLSPEPSRQLYVKNLDHILRKGILHSHAFCSQYPGIVKVLYDNLTVMLWELGIDSIKHIKYILPLLSDTLSHPLVNTAQQQDLLIRALLALQALIQNAWPRMVHYRGEVLKGLLTCWLAILDAGVELPVQLGLEMKKTVQMLKDAVAQQVPWDEEMTELTKVDGRLVELLQ